MKPAGVVKDATRESYDKHPEHSAGIWAPPLEPLSFLVGVELGEGRRVPGAIGHAGDSPVLATR